MASTEDNSGIIPSSNVAPRLASTCSAPTKKIGNGAALKEALNAAPTTLNLPSRVVGKPAEDQPKGKKNGTRPPPVSRQGIKTEVVESSKSPLESTVPYAGLKSARKRKRPGDGEATDSSLPPSLGSNSFRVNPATSEDRDKTSTSTSRHLPFAPAKKPVGKKTHRVHSELVETRTTMHLSEWYGTIDMKVKYSRSDLESLRFIITLRQKCEKAANAKNESDIQKLHSEMRTRLHQMEFYDFLSGVLIRKSRILEDEGLPAIFEAAPSQYPWDIRADSRMLYNKWVVGQLDPHLLRGIDDKKATNSDGKTFKSRSFAKDYGGRITPNYVGEGNLINGMWWPLQICAMRDGAHGEIEAGIHGQVGFGAYSIVVSEGGYRNVDGGTSLEYCGTSGSNGEPSMGTKLLKESFALGNPIRVLRSSGLASTNPYRPAKGLRYDGIYEISGYEILDISKSMHRFSLERCEGQDPIRYKGVEARPSSEEIAAYAKVRVLLGLAA